MPDNEELERPEPLIDHRPPMVKRLIPYCPGSLAPVARGGVVGCYCGARLRVEHGGFMPQHYPRNYDND